MRITENEMTPEMETEGDKALEFRRGAQLSGRPTSRAKRLSVPCIGL
jgi:hypothetical protein